MNKDNLIDSIGNIDEDILSKADEVRSKNKKSGKGWIKWAAIAACFVFVAVGCFFAFRRVQDPVQLSGEITPTYVDKDGVYTNTQFLISGEKFESEDDLENQLSVNVDNKFDIEKTAEGNYLLTFNDELKSDSICNFVINDGNGNDRSYSFQVRAEFGVKSFYPSDSETVDEKSGVEITFTTDAFSNYEEYISIIPDTSHNMEKIGNKIIITPETEWETGRQYTVIVSDTMTDNQGRVLGKSYSSVFFASSGHDMVRRSGSIDETFLTSDVPVIEVLCNVYENYRNYDKVDFNLEVYSFASADDYEKALISAVGLDSMRPVYSYIQDSPEYSYFDTNNMNKYLETTTGLVQGGPDDYSTSYIVLPDVLPEGYYLANATCSINGANYRIQKLLQINDTVVYVRSTENNILVWANDAVSGNPVSGADVIIDGKSCGNTDKDGCFEYGHGFKMHTGTVRVASKEHKPYVTSALMSAQKDMSPADKYYTYIYTDRESYLQTDKISTFGVIKPRDGAEIPEKVTVCFGEISYGYDDIHRREILSIEDSVYVKKEVEVNDDGTFDAVLPINNFSSGYNRCVVVKIDNDIVACKYILIENYVKPAYILDVSIPKICMFAGEKFEFKLNASYYGGIPAAGEMFSVTQDRTGQTYLTTDSEGNASVILQADSYDSIKQPGALYDWAYVYDESLLERVTLYHQGFCVFPNNVMLEAKATLENQQDYHITGLFSKVDLDKANSKVKEFDFYLSEDDYRGEAYDLTAGMSVHKVSYGEPTEYTYYDYINKCNVTTIKYNGKRTESVVYESDITTASGKFDTSVTLEPIKNGYYYFCFTYTDANGREFVENVFPSYDFDTEDTSGIKTYFITDKETVPSYYYNDYYLGEYKLGEDIHFNLLDEHSVPVSGGKMLIGTVNSRTDTSKIMNAGKFDFEFTDKCVPSVNITGAYFDGHRIYSIVTTVLGYDYSERELTAEITTDKEKYRPGDEVKVKVSLKDKEGKAHKGSVNVSVVDEAQFAVAPQSANILSDFYKNNMSNVLLSSSVSYKQHSFAGKDEKGGEGGGGEDEPNPRQNFVDTTAFETVRTDSDGIAELTIKLSDNITDWRITVNAISDDLYCGNGTDNISSSLPFIADMTMGNVFQDGDDISVTVHAYGTAVTDITSTTFTAELTKPDGSTKSLSETAKGRKFASINFGKMPVGSYSIKLTAKSADGEDAIIEKFEVVESADEVAQFEQFDLTDGIKLNATKSPVTLVLSNSNAKYVYLTLSQLYYACGARYDQIIASDAAGRMLKSFADDEDKYLYNMSDRLRGTLQNDDGGIAVNSVADSDMLTTAFAVWCNPDIIDTGMLDNYFYGRDDIEKYIALAALQRPVLIEIKNNLNELPYDDYYSRMIYTCALAALGDDTAASAEFKKTFSQFVVTLEDGKAMINFSDDDYTNDMMTAMAMTVLSATDRDTAAMMLNYLANKENAKDFYGMQYVIYAKNVLRGAHGKSSFEYYIDGEKKSVTLNGAQMKTIKMTLDQLDAAGFKKTDGDISVTAYYTGNTDEITTDTSGEITKTIQFMGEPELGGKVMVEMIFSVPADQYITVTDYIPSGMRFSRADDNDEYSNSWLISQEGQNLTWGICSHTGYARIVYYTRAVAKGDFVINKAYVTMDDKIVAVEPQALFDTIK